MDQLACTYTTDVKKKRKRWLDGVIINENGKLFLYAMPDNISHPHLISSTTKPIGKLKWAKLGCHALNEANIIPPSNIEIMIDQAEEDPKPEISLLQPVTKKFKIPRREHKASANSDTNQQNSEKSETSFYEICSQVLATFSKEGTFINCDCHEALLTNFFQNTTSLPFKSI